MPAEFILVLMCLTAIGITFMDVWGDPREDPRAHLHPTARAKTASSPQSLRFTADEAPSFATSLPRARLAKGPTLTAWSLPTPEPDAIPGFDWRVTARGTTLADPFATPDLAGLMPTGSRFTRSLGTVAGQVDATSAHAMLTRL